MNCVQNNEENDGIRGVIQAVLPKRLYRVRLEQGKTIHAGLSAAMRHGLVRLIVGDRVLVDLSDFDPQRGHIRRKF